MKNGTNAFDAIKCFFVMVQYTGSDANIYMYSIRRTQIVKINAIK